MVPAQSPNLRFQVHSAQRGLGRQQHHSPTPPPPPKGRTCSAGPLAMGYGRGQAILPNREISTQDTKLFRHFKHIFVQLLHLLHIYYTHITPITMLLQVLHHYYSNYTHITYYMIYYRPITHPSND